MIHTATTHRTFNKTLKRELVAKFPAAKYFKKLHVPGVGYVHYVNDANGNSLAIVHKNKGLMQITSDIKN